MKTEEDLFEAVAEKIKKTTSAPGAPKMAEVVRAIAPIAAHVANAIRKDPYARDDKRIDSRDIGFTVGEFRDLLRAIEEMRQVV